MSQNSVVVQIWTRCYQTQQTKPTISNSCNAPTFKFGKSLSSVIFLLPLGYNKIMLFCMFSMLQFLFLFEFVHSSIATKQMSGIHIFRGCIFICICIHICICILFDRLSRAMNQMSEFQRLRSVQALRINFQIGKIQVPEKTI